jgi:vanillate O-demethylase monooxygenase subunit
VRNPHGDGQIPPLMKVRHYAVCERFGTVWIWPGDPMCADVSLLPDFSFLDPQTHYVSRRYLPIQANYQLLIDNFLNLSHLQYLHSNTLGSDKIAGSEVRHEQIGNTVVTEHFMKSEKLTGLLQKISRFSADELVNRRIKVSWDPPGIVAVSATIAEATGTDDTSHELDNSLSAHFVTPETESSLHYFFAFGYSMANPKYLEEFVEYLADIIFKPLAMEDAPMLAAQQKIIEENPRSCAQFSLLSIDTSAIRARCVLERLLEEEIADEEIGWSLKAA